MDRTFDLFDVVTIAVSKVIPYPGGMDKAVPAGSVGTLIEEITPGVWEVEFDRDRGIPFPITAAFREDDLRLQTAFAARETVAAP